MSREEHPLQATWVIWEHKQTLKTEDWSGAMRELCEFSNVEDFWRSWSFMPRPSEVMFDGVTRKEVEGRTIDGFSLFKKGIRPEWEHDANITGSELTFKKALPADVIDAAWENMVLAVIGETIEENDEICGCRVVDKSKKSLKTPMFRLELWLRTTEPTVVDQIARRLAEVLSDMDGKSHKFNPKDFEYKGHQAQATYFAAK